MDTGLSMTLDLINPSVKYYLPRMCMQEIELVDADAMHVDLERQLMRNVRLINS